MHFNGKRLAVFLTVFVYFKVLGVKNAKIDFFKEKLVLRVVFIKLTFKWLQTDLYDLKNTIEILFMVEFFAFLKMLHFSKFFRDF